MTAASSIVFLTTPTSGTGSYWRILTALAGDRFAHRFVSHEIAAAGIELAAWRPEPTGVLYFHNLPDRLNPSLQDPSIRLVVNFRDPRDMACNQYHWALQHPIGKKSEAEIATFRAKVEAEGIDAYTARVDNRPVFRQHGALAQRLEHDTVNTLVVSYAQLCLDFDALVRRLAGFLGLAEAEIPWAQLMPERSDNLATNPHWVGQRWAGSDATPGRYRHDLQPTSIAALDDRYRALLLFLRRLESPALRPLLQTAREATNTPPPAPLPLPVIEQWRIGAAHQARHAMAALAGHGYLHVVLPRREPPETEAEPPGRFARCMAGPAASLWQPFFAPTLWPADPVEPKRRDDAGALAYLRAALASQWPALAESLDQPGAPAAETLFNNALPGHGAVLWTRSANPAALGRVVLMHDAALNRLRPLLAPAFSEALFIQVPAFDPALFSRFGATHVLCVEDERHFGPVPLLAEVATLVGVQEEKAASQPRFAEALATILPISAG